MTFLFEETALWKRTLGDVSTDDDTKKKAKERLRSAYFKMRDRVDDLVKHIPNDCKGLTVHDITHLDALWEVADQIAGPDFSLTPAEAFVFGGSVLLHDSGMTIAAFPGGLTEISKDVAWRDIAHHVLRNRGIKSPSEAQIADPPSEHKQEILFGVLRALHAKRAEELPFVPWNVPGSKGTSIHLLEDTDLRNAYGRSIGRIAHSHHWPIDKVASLNRTVGVAPQLPSAWTLDEVKVACLLRCADAAHIDHRRAPLMLYALAQPRGVSAAHWAFQTKINKPTTRGDTLVYSAGVEFPASEAGAWWICYDTIKMINDELAKSSALLQDLNLPVFSVRRVYGAESPETLATQIRPIDWRPVDAEIRVSDPIALARTLGGASLYGNDPFVGVRELIQNAVDAVRARRAYETRSDKWGEVRVTIEKKEVNGADEIWLHVDDTGIGMSERVMVGPLIDFGRSFWNSSLLREEFPGLESKHPRVVGKYGIGFFATFLLGNRVRVISKRFDAAQDSVKVLEFESLATRPILRTVPASELLQDFCTRVSVRLDNHNELDTKPDPNRRSLSPARTSIPGSLLERISQLILAVNVQVTIDDQPSGNILVHQADWLATNPDDFLLRLYTPLLGKAAAKDVAQRYALILSVLSSSDGTVHGRAALQITATPDFTGLRGMVAAGGFVYQRGNSSLDAPFVGLTLGDPMNAARTAAVSDIPQNVIANWATEQATRCDQSKFRIEALMRLSRQVLALGGTTGSLPVSFLGGKFVSLTELEQTIQQSEEIRIPLSNRYDEDWEPRNIQGLNTQYFIRAVQPNVAVVCIQEHANGLFGNKSDALDFRRRSSAKVEKEELQSDGWNGAVYPLEDIIVRVWGYAPTAKLEQARTFVDAKYGDREDGWVLILCKATTSSGTASSTTVPS